MIQFHRTEGSFVAAHAVVTGTIEELEQLHELLHPSEKSNLLLQSNDATKLKYLLGRIAAKKALMQLIPDDPSTLFIDAGVFSFPVLKSDQNHNLQLTITHCGNTGIAVAFPESHPIGIDLERIDSTRIKALERYCTTSELEKQSDSGLTEIDYLTLIWTVKEALSKVLRTGFNLPKELIEIHSVTPHENYFLVELRHFHQYKAITFKAGSFMFALLIPKKSEVEPTLFIKSIQASISHL